MERSELDIPKRLSAPVAFLAFFSLLLLFVNGLWPQISMFLFAGRVIAPNIIFKVSLLLSSVCLFLINRRIVDKRVLIPYLFFVVYIMAEIIRFKFFLNYDSKFIFWGLNVYYFFIFLIPIVPSLSGGVREKCLIRILLLALIPISALAFLQHFNNSSVLPVESIDGYYRVLVYNFYNHMRAFSFFSASLFFSFYLVLCFLLELYFFSSAKQKKIKVFWSLSLFFTAFLVYVTYARTGYLMASFSLLTFVLLLKFKGSRLGLIKWLPVVYFFSGFLVFLISGSVLKNRLSEKEFISYKEGIASIAETLNRNDFDRIQFNAYLPDSSKHKHSPVTLKTESSSADIVSSDSLVMRIIEWDGYVKLLLSDFNSFMFGRGLYSSPRINSEAITNLCVDNVYFDALIHIGFVGLLLFLFLMWRFWSYTLEKYVGTVLGKVVIAICSTFTLTGFTSNLTAVYLNVLIFVWLSSNLLSYDAP